MTHVRSDAMLMEILSERKTITGFLDAIFGFMRRNTDFYHVKKDKAEKIGFPKGMREQILFGAMQRYDPECVLNNLATEDDGGEYVPPAVEEIEVETDASNQHQTKTEGQHEKAKKVSATQDFTSVDYKSGARFDNYCWSQTLKDVELKVKLPENLRSSRSLSIDIQADKISVRSKMQGGIVVVEGALSNRCKHKDAVWTIAEGTLHICIDKIKEVWWDKLFVNESAIDSRTVDCEQYIDELPESSQAAIEKLRIDQLKQDKEMARPTTTNENETLERLRTAWDAEGSPFRGQPFDPSMVKFN